MANNGSVPARVLTVADLEKRLRVGAKAIRSAIRPGRLKGIKIGGAFRVSESALARFLGEKE